MDQRSPPPSEDLEFDKAKVASSARDGFAHFGSEVLPPVLERALKEKGFVSLTSVQEAVVLSDTHARDVRISSQTGSGKTVAVGVAIGRELLALGARREQASRGAEIDPRAPQVLLLTPTRELASQVRRELAWLFANIPDAFVEVVTGGTSVVLDRKNLARGPRVLVGTPGRVLDHLKSGVLQGKFIEHVILDEADQMLDMGFRDELEGILELLPEKRRTHLVSATFPPEVQRIAEKFQKSPVFLEGSPLGAANEDIEHIVHVVGLRHRYDALVNVLLRAEALRDEEAPSAHPPSTGRTLVFTRTRADALEVAERLQHDGIRAEPLSGDLAQAQRTRTLSAFRSGQVNLLVATDVAARGLDVQGIDLVVHLDPPGDADALTHRSGRTGRAGRKGTSILLLPPQARGRMERLFRIARVKPQWAPVPSAQKIRKLFEKQAKRRIYAAIEASSDDDQLEYARKLLEEHPAEKIVARLLSLMSVAPPCPPREITEHIASEGGKGRYVERARPGSRDHRGADPRRPRRRDDSPEAAAPHPKKWRGEPGGNGPRKGPKKLGEPDKSAGRRRKFR